MSNQELEIAKQWAANSYFEAEDRKEIQQLIDDNQQDEILDRFYRDLEFGTGGLRSHFGMGRNRINRYTVRRATQAMVNVIKSERPSMVISYDSRRGSEFLAKEAASVLAANGVKAYIFDRLNPVPLLSFAIRHLKADAGIMITASHNPPSYNGFKAFWSNGAQVTPPHDQNIIEVYNGLTNWEQITYRPFEEGEEQKRIEWIGKEIEDLYHQMLASYCLNPELCRERGNEIKIVYTPIHGTGKVPCMRALKDIGLTNVQIVPEQAEPDERFSTVSSPNPEDPEALELGVKLMQDTQADLVLGTDPDTDRVGVVCRDGEELSYLNGNQIGILMLNYILERKKATGELGANDQVVKTIVTSELQAEIAQAYGLKIHNTLTGFKWIGKLMTDLENQDSGKFLFASEESFGYLSHPNVRDKDGVNAVALISEVALHYKTQGMTLVDALNQIYKLYSFAQENLMTLKYEGKAGAEKITRIMDHFRNSPISEMAGLKIIQKEDYQSLQTLNYSTNESSSINLPASNVIGFEFEGGPKLYLRPSGTEPKIKFYIMLKHSEGSLEEKKAWADQKIGQIRELISTLVEPI